MTQINPPQPLVLTYPFRYGSSNIPYSLFPHMHTPSALLGRTISQMANNQVIMITTVTKAIQPPYQPSQMSTPYIGGQSSMGIQTLAGGKPSARGKCFTRGNLRG